MPDHTLSHVYPCSPIAKEHLLGMGTELDNFGRSLSLHLKIQSTEKPYKYKDKGLKIEIHLLRWLHMGCIRYNGVIIGAYCLICIKPLYRTKNTVYALNATVVIFDASKKLLRHSDYFAATTP